MLVALLCAAGMGAVAWAAALTRRKVARLMTTPGSGRRTAWDELPWERRQGYRGRLHRLNWLFALLAMILVAAGARQVWGVLQQLRSGLQPPAIIRHEDRTTTAGRLLWEARFSGAVAAAVARNGYVLVCQTQREFAGFRVISTEADVVWERIVAPGADLPGVAIAVVDGTAVLRLEEDTVTYILLPSGEPLAGEPPPASAFTSAAADPGATTGYFLKVSNRPTSFGGVARLYLYWRQEEPLLQ